MKVMFIPDAQVRPGVPVDHLTALGNYIAEKQPDVIVNIGDFWDMPSLSCYEGRGSKYYEGKRVMEDIRAGNEAMDLLLAPIAEANKKAKRRKQRKYNPRMVFCIGNHEQRIERAVNADPKLDGLLDYSLLNLDAWEVVPFLDIIEIEGVLFSHYFVNMFSLKKGVLAGTIDNKLQKVGKSFCMGHQQTLQFGTHYLCDGAAHIGLVAGAFYQHHEDYMGRQGNHHWRGAVMLNDIHDGLFDPMFLSMDYLLRRWL